MSTVSEVIFVDESGDASLTKESLKESVYFCLGYVYCSSPERIRKSMKRLMIRLQKRNHYPKKLNELKFYLPRTKLMNLHYLEDNLNKYQDKMESNRYKMIEVINENCTGVFAAVCDKSQAWRERFPSSDVLGNWLFANTLCKEIIPKIDFNYPPTILYDKGRLTAARSIEFNTYLRDKDSYLRYLGINVDATRIGTATDRSSNCEPGIWASDIIAGAFRHAFNAKDTQYIDTVRVKIGPGYRFYWRE